MLVWFGYELELPTDVSVVRSIVELHQMNEVLPAPFQIKCLLFRADAEGQEEEEAHVILGFAPTTLEDTCHLSDELVEWLHDNPLFYDMEMSAMPYFYGGIEWCPEVDSDSDSEGEETDSEGEDSDSEGYETDSEA